MCTPNLHRSLLIGLTVVLLLAVLPPPLHTAAPRQCPDPYEPNDSFAKAWPLTPPAEIQSYICDASDVDYFAFYAQAAATILVGIDDLPADYNLCLFDPSQKVMACSENKGTVPESIKQQVTQTGQHYALAYGWQGAYHSKDSYTLRLAIDMPDLVVTDLWEEGGDICYQVRNLGEVTAPKGHEVGLYVDGEPIVDDPIDVELAPGERVNGCFAYSWQCSGSKDTVGVCADDDGVLAEEDEGNNCREETWNCDTTAPSIISGPTASGISQTSATISWDTDEEADSTVRYSRYAALYEGEEADAALDKMHSIVLTGLQPGTIYRYLVQSVDASGNAVTSGGHTFQTQLQSDSTKPTMSFFAPTGRELPLEFAAEGADDVGVDRVEFRIDGELMGIDYSPPHAWYLSPAHMGMSRAEFFDDHTMAAVAFDAVGWSISEFWEYDPVPECTLGEFFVRSPYDGLTLFVDGVVVPAGTIIDVELEASETPWEYRPVPGHPEIEMQIGEPVEHVEFYIDHARVYSSSEAITIHRYEWDAGGIGLGDHPVLYRAFSHEGCVQTRELNVRVVSPNPLVTVSREVVREGSVFNVVVSVRNEGTEIAEYAFIDSFVHEGRMAGLQCLAESNPGCDLTCHYSVVDGASEYVITLDTPLTLPPDSAVGFSFPAVPILYAGADDYWIEEVTTDLEYRDAFDNTYTDSFTHPAHEGGGFEDLVEEAVAEADYLIVTNPYNLFGLYDEAEVDELLHRMAELAALPERNGVLGYFNGFHTLATSFNVGDQMALGGHLFGDAQDEEIFLADLGEDLVRSYSGSRELTIADERLPFAHDLSEGDVLAVGNVQDEDSAGDPHHRAEILVAHTDGNVDVYQYNYVPGSDAFEEFGFWSTYDAGDGFAVGNVRGGFGTEDEVVVANHGGWVHIYTDLSSPYDDSFLSAFASGDPFALGDVVGSSSYEEAVIGDLSADRVRVYVHQVGGGFDEDYSITGLELAPEDVLAVGDVHGTEKEEIIIADESEDRIAVYGYDPTAHGFRLISDFGYLFQAEDRLAVGDVFGAGKAQILVARGRSSGLHSEGDVEILSYLAGEAPGDRFALDGLMNDGGAWAERLHADWVDDGHLLIVGEIEIIPAFSFSWDLTGSDRGAVDYSDRDYASTSGDTDYPELSIGRIIGNSAERLQQPIQASLDIVNGDVEFDNSHAYCASGSNRGPSGESDDIDFTEQRDSIADTLRDEGFDVEEHHEPSETSFFSDTSNKDVILMAGHGSRTSWDVISRDEVAGRFNPGRARPVIYAAACTTGRYPGGRSIAEAFFERDAAAFIGSTEVSIWPWAGRVAEGFFSYLDAAHTIGSALRDAKIHRLGVETWAWDPAYNRYNCAIHQLYGDPKLEVEWLAMSAVGAQGSSSAPLLVGPLSSLEVSIPDYEVTPVEDGDRVEIPGGGIVTVYGQPMVPSFSVAVELPKGSQAQDVVLSERGGLVTDTGLDIPLATPAVAGSSSAQAASEGEGWWPDRDFAWFTQEAPDGTVTLHITIYPFFYHSDTTNVRFYQSYTFDVQVATSEVEITGWAMDRHTYDQGEAVRADVYLLSSAKEPMDLIVEGAVRCEATGEIAEGLPLRLLREVQGLVSFALEWDSAGFDPGGYNLEVVIRDTDGTLLDSDARDVSLGRSAGEITRLSVAPEVFDIGETVAISLVFQNVGTVEITGTAVILVRDEGGAMVQESEYDVPELAPGEDITFEDGWDTTGAEPGAYTVVGYVGYGGQAAGPMAVEVNTRRRVYLPLILRAGG